MRIEGNPEQAFHLKRSGACEGRPPSSRTKFRLRRLVCRTLQSPLAPKRKTLRIETYLNTSNRMTLWLVDPWNSSDSLAYENHRISRKPAVALLSARFTGKLTAERFAVLLIQLNNCPWLPNGFMNQTRGGKKKTLSPKLETLSPKCPNITLRCRRAVAPVDSLEVVIETYDICTWHPDAEPPHASLRFIGSDDGLGRFCKAC